MAIKNFRPLTPTQRFKQTPGFNEITKDKPEKSLLEPVKRTGGRNNTGRLTSRHIGGGHKRRYRVIDFKRRLRDVEATVEAIEYDPNRSARIALIQYPGGEKVYILAPNGLGVGSKIVAGDNVAPEIGNALPLKAIPLGTTIHNVELIPGRGGQIARSAGQQAILSNREAGYALVRLPSGEIRRIHENAYATIGQFTEKSKTIQQMKDKHLKKIPGISCIEINGIMHKFTAHDNIHPESQIVKQNWNLIMQKLRMIGYKPKIELVLLNLESNED